jgi:hypothetical protein
MRKQQMFSFNVHCLVKLFMVKLYKIWQTKRTPYALVDVITVLIYYRDEVISTNLSKLQKLCDHLNFIAAEDEHYEVLEDGIVLRGAYDNLRMHHTH